ncbi:AraC family transcriptional regulator [Mesorhizobium sp. CGMCC 1.15528]|uniref:AraC family transcriptional regulator n=1 Tax=Mesorhizobium zhangyense TaxID=1776730 RepID=A0A7C9VHY8_9HYPH|nr:AraC family transcriptional regulator [Mesorhizobium zhangyense]NGN44928.1 AraC family transcriptional regulator [Mesorhizobium zhangyense]
MQRFSTENIPERDRPAFVHEFVARHVAGRQFTPADPRGFHVEIAAFGLPDRVTVGTARYSPLRGARTRDLLGDGRDGYLLTLHTEEHEVSIEGGRPVKVPAGDLMLVNEGTPSDFWLPQTVVRVLSFERSRLARMVPRIDMRASYHIPKTTPGMSLISGYADLLRTNQPQGDKASQIAVNHLYDLAALLLDGFVQGGAERNEPSFRSARLQLVKKHILSRMQDPELSISLVAGLQGVTPRYIQRLFEAEGVTFSEFLRDSRLKLAFQLLSDSDLDKTISEIAYDSGFHDLSNFNRAFRKRFGITPSDVRAEGMRKHFS